MSRITYYIIAWSHSKVVVELHIVRSGLFVVGCKSAAFEVLRQGAWGFQDAEKGGKKKKK
jgi:hypothetical protein